MAEEVQKEDPKSMFLKPVIDLGKAIVLFADVATLMLRLLFNTVAHDSPHGKLATAEARDVMRGGSGE